MDKLAEYYSLLAIKDGGKRAILHGVADWQNMVAAADYDAFFKQTGVNLAVREMIIGGDDQKIEVF